MNEKTIVALHDPAFNYCIKEAVSNVEFVRNFDRLSGTNLSRQGSPIELNIDLATGRLDADMSLFLDSVRDVIYDRLAPEVLVSLRAAIKS